MTTRDGVYLGQPDQPIQPPINHWLQDLIEREVAKGPMTIVSGPDREHFTSPRQDDDEVLSRIKHTMKPGEQLMAWYARTGLGRAAILAGMTKSEISAFVAQADRNEADREKVQTVMVSRPKEEPQPLRIVV